MIWRVGRGVGVRRGGANNVRVDALEIPRPYYAPNPQSSTLSPEPFVHYHSCFHQVHAKLVVSCVVVVRRSLRTVQLPVLAPQALDPKPQDPPSSDCCSQTSPGVGLSSALFVSCAKDLTLFLDLKCLK